MSARRGGLWASLVFAGLLWGGGAAQAQKLFTPPPAPAIPAPVFRITDYGAKPGAATLATEAIQSAVAACAKAGGGTVEVPAGRFVTGPFTLPSHTNLRVVRGATLAFTDDKTRFRLTENRYEDCIRINDAHDVAITGDGTLDGQGAAWWRDFLPHKSDPPGSPPYPHRPHLIALNRCTRVLVEGVTLTNSPMFHLVPSRCVDVTIRAIHIKAPDPSPNTDGIDPSGRNFWITGCTFDGGDDCIAVKPAGLVEPGHVACENFLIENCNFLHGHGLSIGGQTPSGLKHMLVRNCTFRDTQAGIRMKAARGSGGLVEDVTYENLTMINVKVAVLITSYYPRIPKDPAADPAQAVGATTPIWRNIHITNVTATGGAIAGQLVGLAEMPIDSITFTHVNLSAQKGLQVYHARNIVFVRSHVKAEAGPLVTQANAQVKGLPAPP